jgi:hypothetical protein
MYLTGLGNLFVPALIRLEPGLGTYRILEPAKKPGVIPLMPSIKDRGRLMLIENQLLEPSREPLPFQSVPDPINTLFLNSTLQSGYLM